MSLDQLLNGSKTVAVLCNQWGDTGKGKICHYIAPWADVIARGTGGNNAGHTIIHEDQEVVFHLIPSGIVYDSEEKINIIGNGTVIDTEVLAGEMDELDAMGLTYNNLLVSEDAQVVMPYHIARDQAKNKSLKNGGIGSTGRGIGPCYGDKILRRGVMIRDLYDVDKLVTKINKALPFYDEFNFSVEEIIEGLQPTAKRIKPYVADTINKMHGFMENGKKILLEGAQGLLLSIEYGTYPYVTSSDCSLAGTATGVGLSARDIDVPLGLIKFPVMTRVGGGPFPTEIAGTQGDLYCRDETKDKLSELERHGIDYKIVEGKIKYDHHHKKILDMMNSQQPLVKAVGIRLAAGEFGATTGRPRRVGWVDAVAAKYARNVNGPHMVLTKVDSFADLPEFNVCYGYETGNQINTNFIKDSSQLAEVNPRYRSYEGYPQINGAYNYDHLPGSLKQAVGDFERFTKGNVVMVSIGPKREQTLTKVA